jgi:hypothetical protein
VILTRQLQHKIRVLLPESGRPTQPPPVDSLFHCLSFSSPNSIRPTSEVLKILLPGSVEDGDLLTGPSRLVGMECGDCCTPKEPDRGNGEP